MPTDTQTFIICRYDDGDTRQFQVYESGPFDTTRLFRADAYVLAMQVLQVLGSGTKVVSTQMPLHRCDIRQASIVFNLEGIKVYPNGYEENDLMTFSYIPQGKLRDRDYDEYRYTIQHET